MKYFIYIIIIIILLSLNIGLFGHFRFFNTVPNLLFLLLLFFSLEKYEFDFFFIAFFCGIMLDLFAATFLGTFIFSFLVLAYVLHEFVAKIAVFEVDRKWQILFMAVSLQILNLLLWSYNFFAFKIGLSPDLISLKDLEKVFVPQFIYNLLLFYPVYLLYYGIKSLILKLNSRKYKVL